MTREPEDNFNPSLSDLSDASAMGLALHRLYACWSDPSNPQVEDVDALWEEIVGRFPWLEPGDHEQ